jgi:hypothetical protein
VLSRGSITRGGLSPWTSNAFYCCGVNWILIAISFETLYSTRRAHNPRGADFLTAIRAVGKRPVSKNFMAENQGVIVTSFQFGFSYSLNAWVSRGGRAGG